MAISILTFVSLLGLIILYFFSLYAGYVLHILNDAFYAPFHFLGGVFTALFFYSLTQNVFLTVPFVLTIGVLWEIYEQVVWKVFVRKNKLRPKLNDTASDLIFDTLGALLIVFLFS